MKALKIAEENDLKAMKLIISKLPIKGLDKAFGGSG